LGPLYTKFCLTDKYDLLTIRISFIPVLIRDHQTRLPPCGDHLITGGYLPWNRCHFLADFLSSSRQSL
jgi:hypothetical protein